MMIFQIDHMNAQFLQTMLKINAAADNGDCLFIMHFLVYL